MPGNHEEAKLATGKGVSFVVGSPAPYATHLTIAIAGLFERDWRVWDCAQHNGQA